MTHDSFPHHLVIGTDSEGNVQHIGFYSSANGLRLVQARHRDLTLHVVQRFETRNELVNAVLQMKERHPYGMPYKDGIPQPPLADDGRQNGFVEYRMQHHPMGGFTWIAELAMHQPSLHEPA